jgi:hypothetical protein
MSNNNFDPVKEKHEAHAKLINRFGGFEAYFDFVLQRQEEQIKQGVKYIDFSRYRPKLHGNIFLKPSHRQLGDWNPTDALEPLVEGFARQTVDTPICI